MTEPRCVLFHDNFQNFKSYNIPKAQLVIADIPYNIGSDFYASRPDWYVDGDNRNGESTRHHRFCRCHCHHAKHRQFLQTALDREYGRHRKCVVFYPRCRYPNLHVCCSHKDAGQNKICSYSSPFTT